MIIRQLGQEILLNIRILNTRKKNFSVQSVIIKQLGKIILLAIMSLFTNVSESSMLSEHHRNYSQSLQYFFNFGFLGPLHNLSIRLLTAAADKSFSVHSVIMKPLRKAILQLIRCRCTEGVRRKWKNSLTTHFKSVHRGGKFKFPECVYK